MSDIPRRFVLYVGDAPTRFEVSALDRAGAKVVETKHIGYRVGRTGIVEVRKLGDAEPCTDYAITPLAAGLTGLVFQSLDADLKPLGQVEVDIDVRPADGHTLSIDAGPPDASLAPPPPPLPETELPVATSHEVSPKNRIGDGSAGVGTGAADKASVLRAKLLERYRLPSDATDQQVYDAISAGMEASYAQGKTEAIEGAGAACGGDPPKKNLDQGAD